MILLWSSAVLAHEPGLSRVTVERGSVPRLVLQVHRIDAADPAALLSGTRASVDGRPCALGVPDVRPDDNGFVAEVELRCPLGERMVVEAGWLAQMPPGHRTAVELDGAAAGLVDAAHPVFDADRAPSTAEIARGYLQLGVIHIATGFDHLAFLIGLLLAARSARSMLGVVTGFTVAHSVTLSLGALGLLHVPSAVVEPLIAASVVWVGVENLFDPPDRRRFVLTMSLGLIHGLGFAGLLAEIGLPAGAVPLALATFNLGVELGQMLVLAAALPLLLAIRRSERWRRPIERAGSVAVAAAGAAWLVMRLA